MKFKSFNRVLAALLMLTMLAGQVLMSTAMALNEEPGIVILDESDLLEAEPTPTPAAESPEGGELPAGGSGNNRNKRGRPYRHTHSRACRTH